MDGTGDGAVVISAVVACASPAPAPPPASPPPELVGGMRVGSGVDGMSSNIRSVVKGEKKRGAVA